MREGGIVGKAILGPSPKGHDNESMLRHSPD
jgi:hypothetical protein